MIIHIDSSTLWVARFWMFMSGFFTGLTVRQAIVMYKGRKKSRQDDHR